MKLAILWRNAQLAGCISQGATYEEALANIKEAIDLWITYAQGQGREIPADYPIRIESV
jgi:predicted RNase H-like HicB family nuclease